jgi:hypothetical protein
MSHYSAHASCRDMERGTSFTIQSGSLRRGDILNLHCPDDHTVQGGVERFDATGLYLNVNGTHIKCRPWCTGDASTGRPSGTLSKWTVEHIQAVADA